MQQIYIWKPMTTGFIMQTLLYVISMQFLSLRRRLSSWRNFPSSVDQDSQARSTWTRLAITPILDWN